MSSDEQPRASRPGVDGWDRIGELMSRMNETGAVIAQRQVDVWNEISASLRDPDYGADAWARNNARVFGAMLDNLQDMAGLWTGATTGQPVAGVIPTVFLFLETDERDELAEDSLPDVPQIAAPRWISQLPARARISLSGGPDKDSSVRLRDAISVVRSEDDPGMYDVVYTAKNARVRLAQGGYVGLIYLRLERTEVPLADLRVVVRQRSSG
jgi:hypothetical protein